MAAARYIYAVRHGQKGLHQTEHQDSEHPLKITAFLTTFAELYDNTIPTF